MYACTMSFQISGSNENVSFSMKLANKIIRYVIKKGVFFCRGHHADFVSFKNVNSVFYTYAHW